MKMKFEEIVRLLYCRVQPTLIPNCVAIPQMNMLYFTAYLIRILNLQVNKEIT